MIQLSWEALGVVLVAASLGAAIAMFVLKWFFVPRKEAYDNFRSASTCKTMVAAIEHAASIVADRVLTMERNSAAAAEQRGEIKAAIGKISGKIDALVAMQNVTDKK